MLTVNISINLKINTADLYTTSLKYVYKLAKLQAWKNRMVV